MSSVRAPWLPALTAIVLYAADSPIAQTGTSVLVFTRTDCPISNRYAPELNALSARSPNVRFALIYVDPAETQESVARHKAEFGYSMPSVLDVRHELVRRAGVRTTPEVAVYRNGELVYRGRIDDRYVSPGVTRPKALSHDLADILDALSRGERVRFRSTSAVGCAIQDLR
jgi:hypothetical protein